MNGEKQNWENEDEMMRDEEEYRKTRERCSLMIDNQSIENKCSTCTS